jgi:hypothetical protein
MPRGRDSGCRLRSAMRKRREGAEFQELRKRARRDAIRRLKPFEEGVHVDQMNDETRPRKPNTAAGILDVPINRREPHSAASRARIFMRLRREWTNLGALIALHSDIVVSNTCDRAFASERDS